ncbi:hypothetical protein BD289DRAFT_377836 [Coniella lustricola]|uniref:Galactose oxidase n=1 Tax=Coniella lustricola TaxID=2025994 RepID=A0A2T2ZV03_9PEZI|nr:hypothetical protein BD289DRAFT_377836 [Coniella lustricola]
MADPTAQPNDIISDSQASPLRAKIIRSQKISGPSYSSSPAAATAAPTLASFQGPVSSPPAVPTSSFAARDIATDSIPPIPRNHTPGHLASKSAAASRRKPSSSDLSIRQRAASTTATVAPGPNPSPPAAPHTGSPKASTLRGAPRELRSVREPADQSATDAVLRPPSSLGRDKDGLSGNRRPPALRSTSAIAARPAPIPGAPASTTTNAAAANGTTTTTTTVTTSSKHPSANQQRSSTNRSTKHASIAATYNPFPPLASPSADPDVPSAPSSGMYWSRAPVSGQGHPPLRAHTTTIIGSNVYVFGGCDSRACFNDLYVLDADAFHWSRPYVSGDIPVPLRAMTCTAVGKKLVIFGGGDGPAYYNDVYVLDTVNFRWTKPRVLGDRAPSKRRAHTACLYKNGIYVFGGGDGVRALNDIWRLDVSDLTKMSWKLVSSPLEGGSGTGGKDLRPKARGYHTANIVDGKLIIFGGSDGGECFNDVWVYNIETQQWRTAPVSGTFRRLSHTATIVGSYLFVIGGHDGSEYSNDVLLLNLVQMTWDKRRVYGLPPSGRGYHGTVLHDSRLLTIGGFDGGEVFGDVWILEMAVHAYYSQISHFQIDV